jgi:hypothetical protein
MQGLATSASSQLGQNQGQKMDRKVSKSEPCPSCRISYRTIFILSSHGRTQGPGNVRKVSPALQYSWYEDTLLFYYDALLIWNLYPIMGQSWSRWMDEWGRCDVSPSRISIYQYNIKWEKGLHYRDCMDWEMQRRQLSIISFLISCQTKRWLLFCSQG